MAYKLKCDFSAQDSVFCLCRAGGGRGLRCAGADTVQGKDAVGVAGVNEGQGYFVEFQYRA